MPKAAGKEHLQHRLYQTVTPLRRPLGQPRFETVHGKRATFEFDRHISELRVSTTGNQQFIGGKDLRDLKKLLQQEGKPEEGRRRNRALRPALRPHNQVPVTEEGRVSFDQWQVREQEQRNAQPPRFGSIVYQTEGYAEYLLTDEKGVRVVIGESEGSIKLYRVEWTEPDGYQRNRAIYSLPDAIAAFQGVVGQQQPSRRQEPEQLTEEWIVPEVERGECNATQAAVLGLPYRHRVTGETIAEWAERRASAETHP